MSTYLLVHGICHGAWCWDETRAQLEAAGHETVAVELPMTGADVDAACVSDALDAIDGPVILVGHSYGGLVISIAAAGRSDVSHLVYVAAVLVGADVVFMEDAMRFPQVPLVADATYTDDGRVLVGHDAAVAGFFNRCDPEDARRGAERLRPAALSCLTTPPGAQAWTEIAATYVVCEHDAAIHPEHQRAMSSNAATVHTLDTDHSPFYSARAELVSILLGAA